MKNTEYEQLWYKYETWQDLTEIPEENAIHPIQNIMDNMIQGCKGGKQPRNERTKKPVVINKYLGS